MNYFYELFTLTSYDFYPSFNLIVIQEYHQRYLREAALEIRHALSDLPDALFEITASPEDIDNDNRKRLVITRTTDLWEAASTQIGSFPGFSGVYVSVSI